ncbi:MAG: sulfatase-like hydrolase/transferase, partial [Phycisphaerae bacterium]|nr:sulfatase-like hydrolase/transferase [Phycisphaerae bacterium]
MSKRVVLAVSAAVVGCSVSGIGAMAAGAVAGRPNIILCMADDQGWGDVAYAGHPVLKTPNLDSMAAAGLRFDRFYAAAPVCSPTRGSVMTGRHPNRFGCFSWGFGLRPQETTIAEALKSHGYVTGHFGKWHLGSVQKGSPVHPGASGFDAWFSAPNFFDNDPILSREGVAVQTRGESSMVTVDAAIEFIRQHADTPQPFFAVVWFGSPHVPHKAAEADRAVYADQPKNRQDFYGEITGMDRAIGKLRSTLRTLGVQDNTL